MFGLNGCKKIIDIPQKIPYGKKKEGL